MKFYLYYTMITGGDRLVGDDAAEALAVAETLRLAGGNVTKIVDDKGAAYTLAEIEKLAAQDGLPTGSRG